MTTINPAIMIDGYKTGHKDQYPENTQEVYSNFTPRNNKHFKQWKVDNNFVLHEEVSIEEEKTGLLTIVFKNGKLIKETSFLEIIEKITL